MELNTTFYHSFTPDLLTKQIPRRPAPLPISSTIYRITRFLYHVDYVKILFLRISTRTIEVPEVNGTLRPCASDIYVCAELNDFRFNGNQINVLGSKITLSPKPTFSAGTIERTGVLLFPT